MCTISCVLTSFSASRPARGEWIEISHRPPAFFNTLSRPARGEWIEIISLSTVCSKAICLAPRGASGLKCADVHPLARRGLSRPARGEWIEISRRYRISYGTLSLAPRGASGLKSCVLVPSLSRFQSRPARGEWIEIISSIIFCPHSGQSRPARGEWIEINPTSAMSGTAARLAPRGASGLKS